MDTTAARSDVVDVILRDGATLRLRPPTPADAEALVAFFAGLSDESRHLRFHGGRRIDRSLVDHLFAGTDDRGALVAVAADEGGGEQVVALAEYARLGDARAAEVASPSPTSGRASAWAPGCSSSWPPARAVSASSASSPM